MPVLAYRAVEWNPLDEKHACCVSVLHKWLKSHRNRDGGLVMLSRACKVCGWCWFKIVGGEKPVSVPTRIVFGQFPSAEGIPAGWKIVED